MYKKKIDFFSPTWYVFVPKKMKAPRGLTSEDIEEIDSRIYVNRVHSQ